MVLRAWGRELRLSAGVRRRVTTPANDKSGARRDGRARHPGFPTAVARMAHHNWAGARGAAEFMAIHSAPLPCAQ